MRVVSVQTSKAKVPLKCPTVLDFTRVWAVYAIVYVVRLSVQYNVDVRWSYISWTTSNFGSAEWAYFGAQYAYIRASRTRNFSDLAQAEHPQIWVRTTVGRGHFNSIKSP